MVNRVGYSYVNVCENCGVRDVVDGATIYLDKTSKAYNYLFKRQSWVETVDSSRAGPDNYRDTSKGQDGNYINYVLNKEVWYSFNNPTQGALSGSITGFTVEPVNELCFLPENGRRLSQSL